MSLTQRGASGNTIGDAEQDGTGNKMTVDQNGSGNEIANSFQGNFNNIINSFDGTMDITQKGSNNYIDTASQAGTGQNMSLTFNGNNNGQGGAFTHTETTEVVDLVNGAETIPTSSTSTGGSFGQGYAMQAGAGNSMTMHFTGNGNMFALGQFGAIGDTITGNVNGSYNEVALYQDNLSGGGNLIDMAMIGHDNVLGVHQTGSGNTLTSTQNGNSNVASAYQAGTFNTMTVNQ